MCKAPLVFRGAIYFFALPLPEILLARKSISCAATRPLKNSFIFMLIAPLSWIILCIYHTMNVRTKQERKLMNMHNRSLHKLCMLYNFNGA